MKILLPVCGFYLSFLISGYAQKNEIIRVNIPAKYSKLNNKEIIKELLIRPKLDRKRFIVAADTIIDILEVCGGNGVYYYGRGLINHTSASYCVVVKVNTELRYAYDKTSLFNHKLLIQSYYDDTWFTDCFYSHDEPLMSKVVKLVDFNRKKVSSDKF